MAWTTPITASVNATFTAAQFNASVRDNLNETAPAKTTVAGSYMVGTAANAIAQRIPLQDIVGTQSTTASTSYAALTTPASAGPSVTVTSGITALVIIGAQLSNATAAEYSIMGYVVTGATSVAATDTTGVGHTSSGTGRFVMASRVIFQGVNAGSNQFTAQYKVSGSTGTFSQRSLAVFPY